MWFWSRNEEVITFDSHRHSALMALDRLSDTGLYVHLAAQEATSSVMEPRKQKRKRQETVSFCQQLVQDLDRVEADKQKARVKKRKQLPPSRILALPVELRQQVLYHVLDDEAILRLAFDHEALKLSSVCEVFKIDMEIVLRWWEQRKEELSVVSRGAFDTYMAELMAPVQSASKLVAQIKGIPGASRRRQKSTSWNDARKLDDKQYRFYHGSTFRYANQSSWKSSRWSEQRWTAPSPGEMEERDTWRKNRESRRKAVLQLQKKGGNCWA